MLNENQAKLDNLNNKEKLLPIFSKVMLLLFFVGLAYLAYFYKIPLTNNLNKIEETGKFKAEAGVRAGGHFCSIELKNRQIITLACPNKFYYVGEEIKLYKILNSTNTYYEVQDEVSNMLKTLTHHSSGTPNGAP